MAARLRLDVVLWVPVGVIDDDRVRRHLVRVRVRVRVGVRVRSWG